MRRKLAVIVCLLWMAFIFYQSSQTSQQSNELSHEIVNYIGSQQKEETKVETPESMVIQESKSSFEQVNVFIRKSAHAFEFFILSILLAWVLIEYHILGWKVTVMTLLAVLLYAMSDEFHQLFVEGRSARIFDVTVDFVGGVIGISFVQLILKIRQIKSLGNSKLLLVSNGGALMTETVESREISVIAKLERIEIKL